MQIAQVSPKSVMANPSNVNPLAQTSSHAATILASQAAQQAVTRTKTDTVAISPQAAKMSSKAERFADKEREGASGKPSQKAGGKR